MKVSARSAGGQVCILHLARFNDFPGTKIVAIEPVQKTKPREKMAYFSLTAKLELLTFVRPAATAGAHSRFRNAFGEETLTSCLTRVGGPEIGWGVRQKRRPRTGFALQKTRDAVAKPRFLDVDHQGMLPGSPAVKYRHFFFTGMHFPRENPPYIRLAFRSPSFRRTARHRFHAVSRLAPHDA